MSILIKGASLPKGCASCDYAQFHEGYDLDDYDWFCPFSGEPVDEYTGIENNRAPFCPLIETPPQGSLIDKNKLVEQFNGIIYKAYLLDINPKIINLLELITEIIKDAPEITESEADQ